MNRRDKRRKRHKLNKRMEALADGALVEKHTKLDFNSNDIKSDDEYKIWVFIIVMIIIIVIIVNLDEDYEGGRYHGYHSNPYDDFFTDHSPSYKKKGFFSHRSHYFGS